MEAVVLELKNGYAAVLRKDGTVEKIKGDYLVGQTVEVPDTLRTAVPGWSRGLRAAVAAVVMLGILGTGGYSYQNVLAYSYVSLDMGETSLEYTLNRRDRVIAVAAMNDGSEAVADALGDSLRRSSLPEAIRNTVDYLEDSKSGDYALVAVAAPSEDRARDLADRADDALSPGQVALEAETASPADRRSAGEQGMSMGRWHLHQQFGQDPSEEGQDFRNGSLDELTGQGGAHKKPAQNGGPEASSFPAGQELPPEAPRKGSPLSPDAPQSPQSPPDQAPPLQQSIPPQDAPHAPAGEPDRHDQAPAQPQQPSDSQSGPQTPSGTQPGGLQGPGKP